MFSSSQFMEKASTSRIGWKLEYHRACKPGMAGDLATLRNWIDPLQAQVADMRSTIRRFVPEE
jgi:hypothetical protein